MLENVAKKTNTAIVVVKEGRGYVGGNLRVGVDKIDREKRCIQYIGRDYPPIRLVMDEGRRVSFAEMEK